MWSRAALRPNFRPRPRGDYDRAVQAPRGRLYAAHRDGTPLGDQEHRRYPFLDAIDVAISELGIKSFASLDNGVAYGEQAFYAAGKPEIERGVLADVRPTRAPDQLLNAIEVVAGYPELRVVDGDALAPAAGPGGRRG